MIWLYYDIAVARLLRFVARSWKQQFASRGGLLYVRGIHQPGCSILL